MKFVTVRPGNVSFGIAPSVEQERPGGCAEAFSTVYNLVTVPDWRRLPRVFSKGLLRKLTQYHHLRSPALPHTTTSTVRTPHAVLGCKELRKGAGKTRAQHDIWLCLFLAVSERLFLVPPLCWHEVCVHAWKTESGNLEFACCFFAIKWEFEQMRVWGPKPYSLE